MAIDQVAGKRGVSRAQIALAWVLAQGVVVIPGAKKVAHWRDNVETGSLALDADDVGFLSDACPVGKAAGARCNEGAARWIDRSP